MTAFTRFYWILMTGLSLVVATGAPTVRFIASSVVPLLVAGALAVGATRHRPGRRWPWNALAVGFGFIGVGQLLVSLRLYVWDLPPVPVGPTDAFYVAAYLCCLVGIFGIAHPHAVRRDRGMLLDIAVAVGGVAAPLHALVLKPIFDAADTPMTGRMVLLGYILFDLIMLVALSRLLLGRVRRSRSLTILLTGMGLIVAIDLVYVGLAANGATTTMMTYLLMGYVPADSLIGAAALHASARHFDDPVVDNAPRFGRARLVAIGIALLLPAVTTSIVHSRGHHLGWIDLVAPSAILVVLVLARLHGLFSATKAAAAEAIRMEERRRVLLDSVSDHLVVTDVTGVLLDTVNSRLSSEIPVGQSVFHSLRKTGRERFSRWLEEALAKPGEAVVHRFATPHPNGDELREYEVTVRNMLSVDAVRGIVWVARDITERAYFERELVQQALHDALTGLPNRVLFADRLAQARTRRAAYGVAVYFVDLDNFKTINDSLGHEAGDVLLQSVAARFRSAFRAEDTVARLGGDEFAVLVELRAADDPVEIGRRLLAVLAEPVDVAGQRLAVTASVGVAVAADGEDADLLGQADIAMYQAKGAGRNLVVCFEEGMQTVASERLQVAMELVDALERDEFRVAYQPIVDLATDTIVGVEALLRWHHPLRGTVPPLDFIPTAEENGLIVPIGRFVLRDACRQAQAWSVEHGRPLKVSVNLSARQLESDSLVDDVRAALSDAGLPADQLVLELTESVLVRNVEGSAARLHELKALGVRVAIDDFGTGYSSLAYLRQFPIDVLKIDRSFVAAMGESDEASAVVRALVDMGRALHLETLAEGVEEEEQAALLRAERCDFAQGFLFAKPVSSEVVSKLLGGHMGPKAVAALSPGGTR